MACGSGQECRRNKSHSVFPPSKTEKLYIRETCCVNIWNDTQRASNLIRHTGLLWYSNSTFEWLFYIHTLFTIQFFSSTALEVISQQENTVLRRQQRIAFFTPLRQHVRAWRTSYKARFSDVSGLFPAYALERWAALISRVVSPLSESKTIRQNGKFIYFILVIFE